MTSDQPACKRCGGVPVTDPDELDDEGLCPACAEEVYGEDRSPEYYNCEAGASKWP